jgi:hypothetical protein
MNWRRPGLLGEDLENNDCIRRDVVDDSPRLAAIIDSQLVAMMPDCGHWPRMGQTQKFVLAGAAWEAARLPVWLDY